MINFALFLLLPPHPQSRQSKRFSTWHTLPSTQKDFQAFAPLRMSPSVWKIHHVRLNHPLPLECKLREDRVTLLFHSFVRRCEWCRTYCRRAGNIYQWASSLLSTACFSKVFTSKESLYLTNTDTYKNIPFSSSTTQLCPSVKSPHLSESPCVKNTVGTWTQPLKSFASTNCMWQHLTNYAF